MRLSKFLLMVPAAILLSGCPALGPAATQVPIWVGVAGAGTATATFGLTAFTECKQLKGCNDVPLPP